VRIRRVGPSALLLECGDPDTVQAWYAVLTAQRAAVEIVPAATTILLDGVAEPDTLARKLADRPVPAPVPAGDGGLVEVPTVYDGPDLDDVAGYWGTDRRGVIDRHTGTAFRVAFCGFAPGFAYLTGLAPRYHVPRRRTPRPRVPAGAVALAGEFAGVYPAASPGGWQLIGRTFLRLFDLDADPPAMLTPGTRVRFVQAQR
jgi:KipI family sensor histidine kinase inhibitor